MATPNLIDAGKKMTKKVKKYSKDDLEAKDTENTKKTRSASEVRKAMYGAKE